MQVLTLYSGHVGFYFIFSSLFVVVAVDTGTFYLGFAGR